LIVSSNNEPNFCGASDEIFQWVVALACLSPALAGRDAHRSAEPYDVEPAVSDHAADHALGHLPVLGHLMDGQ
jgi:hypothetical protein